MKYTIGDIAILARDFLPYFHRGDVVKVIKVNENDYDVILDNTPSVYMSSVSEDDLILDQLILSEYIKKRENGDL